ncbi:MAG TPA: amidohydrolase family protein [Bryobacteraceae bacterium]|nr:amidohydrolase family protein [Bryobacteraceae bacterium]
MRTITLEEHFATPGFLKGPGSGIIERAARQGGRLARIAAQLQDVDELRIVEMDAAGIEMQVLSLSSPGVEQCVAAEAVELAREANEFVAAAMKRHPKRFGGFATLPTADPPRAAEELERVVGQYGFQGALINGHHRGRYLDDPIFWPILERAVALRVPIYLHPTEPPETVLAASYAGFSPEVAYMFATAGWGWHIETGVHVLRMILGGVFDRFPELEIIIGHMGEALPFMLQRADIMTPEITGLQRPISAYLRGNVHYTFSGFNFTPTFLDLLLEVGVDRIMFSADYPYASMTQARAFLDRLPVSDADRERIAHGNAEQLMKFPGRDR